MWSRVHWSLPVLWRIVSSRRFIGVLAQNFAWLRRLLTVCLLMRRLTIHRLHSVFAVLNGCFLATLLRSISSRGVVFRGCHVPWRSFTLPVKFTPCFIRTMTELLTLNRSVGHTTTYHSNCLPSLCIWQFSTCHVEINRRRFTCSARVDTDLKPPPNLSFVKVQVTIKACFVVLWLIGRWKITGTMKEYYMLLIYQTGYIMWYYQLMIYIPWGAAEGNIYPSRKCIIIYPVW
jgi:hypothetical protein